MALRPFRATVGARAIRAGRLKPWQEAYTRAIREQLTELNKHYSTILRDTSILLIDDIGEAFLPIFKKSQEYVPVYSGALQDSGFFVVRRAKQRTSRVTKVITYNRREPILQIGYGAANKPFYATIVHEDLSARHRPPTRAKFLEVALKEEQPRAIKTLKNMLQVQLRKRGAIAATAGNGMIVRGAEDAGSGVGNRLRQIRQQEQQRARRRYYERYGG